MFHVKHQPLSNTTKPRQPTTPRFTWNNRNYEITKGKPKIAVWKCHSPLPAIPTISVSRETWKLIQRPQTWLVSVSKEKQARWFILSDFPLVSVDRFSQLLNKLQGRRDVPRETTPTFRSHQTYVSRETLKSFQESTNPNGKPLAIQHSPIRTQHTHLLQQTAWILKIYGIRSSIFCKAWP